jgi:hypothetical protein
MSTCTSTTRFNADEFAHMPAVVDGLCRKCAPAWKKSLIRSHRQLDSREDEKMLGYQKLDSMLTKMMKLEYKAGKALKAYPRVRIRLR